MLVRANVSGSVGLVPVKLSSLVVVATVIMLLVTVPLQSDAESANVVVANILWLLMLLLL